MKVRSEIAVRGFISRAPEQKSRPGEVFLMVTQIGQKDRRREENGTFTVIGSAYVDLVMLGEKAEEAFKEFAQGDDVVALGEFRKRTYVKDGQRIEHDQFRASRLIFDTSRARYAVERTRRESTLGRPAAAEVTSVEFHAPVPRRAAGLGR